jgi:hypothetical protein
MEIYHYKRLQIAEYGIKELLNFPLFNEVARSQESLISVIPAPYQVRGKLQPGDRREAE